MFTVLMDCVASKSTISFSGNLSKYERERWNYEDRDQFITTFLYIISKKSSCFWDSINIFFKACA